MSHALSLINARIRDIENKLIRIRNGECNLRCTDQVRTTLGIILVQLEEEKYSIMYS
jgi:hypothetical protein